LKRDSTLVLFDYPLVYEFLDEILNSRPPLAHVQFGQPTYSVYQIANGFINLILE
jgi:hypothetical protein